MVNAIGTAELRLDNHDVPAEVVVDNYVIVREGEFVYWYGRVMEINVAGDDLLLTLADPSITLEDEPTYSTPPLESDIDGTVTGNKITFPAGFTDDLSIGDFIFIGSQDVTEREYDEETGTWQSYRAESRNADFDNVPVIAPFGGMKEIRGFLTAPDVYTEYETYEETWVDEGFHFFFHLQDLIQDVSNFRGVQYSMERAAITGRINRIVVHGKIRGNVTGLGLRSKLYVSMKNQTNDEWEIISTTPQVLGVFTATPEFEFSEIFIGDDARKYYDATNNKFDVMCIFYFTRNRSTSFIVDKLRVDVFTETVKNDPVNVPITKISGNDVWGRAAPLLEEYAYDSENTVVIGKRVSSLIPTDYTFTGVAANFTAMNKRQKMGSISSAIGLSWFCHGLDTIVRFPRKRQDEIRFWPHHNVALDDIDERWDVNISGTADFTMIQGTGSGGLIRCRQQTGGATSEAIYTLDHPVDMREFRFSSYFGQADTGGGTGYRPFHIQLINEAGNVIVQYRVIRPPHHTEHINGLEVGTLPHHLKRYKLVSDNGKILVFAIRDGNDPTWVYLGMVGGSMHRINRIRISIEKLAVAVDSVYYVNELAWETFNVPPALPIDVEPVPKFRSVASSVKQVDIWSQKLEKYISIPDGRDPSFDIIGNKDSPRIILLTDNEMWSEANIREKGRVVLESYTKDAETALVHPVDTSFPRFTGHHVFLEDGLHETSRVITETLLPLLIDTTGFTSASDFEGVGSWMTNDTPYTQDPKPGDCETFLLGIGLGVMSRGSGVRSDGSAQYLYAYALPAQDGQFLAFKHHVYGSHAISYYSDAQVIVTDATFANIPFILDFSFQSHHSGNVGTVTLVTGLGNPQFDYTVSVDYSAPHSWRVEFGTGANAGKFRIWLDGVQLDDPSAAPDGWFTHHLGGEITVAYLAHGDVDGTHAGFSSLALVSGWNWDAPEEVELPHEVDGILEISFDDPYWRVHDHLVIEGSGGAHVYYKAAGEDIHDHVLEFPLKVSKIGENVVRINGEDEVEPFTFDTIEIDGVFEITSIQGNWGYETSTLEDSFDWAPLGPIPVNSRNNNGSTYEGHSPTQLETGVQGCYPEVRIIQDPVVPLVGGWFRLVVGPGAVDANDNFILIGATSWNYGFAIVFASGTIRNYWATIHHADGVTPYTYPIDTEFILHYDVYDNRNYMRVKVNDGPWSEPIYRATYTWDYSRINWRGIAVEMREWHLNNRRHFLPDNRDPWFVRRVDAEWNANMPRLRYRLDLGEYQTEGIEKVERKLRKLGDDVTSLKVR